MILKKPYAFLIKYFKLINLVLATLAIYIAYKTYNIINFFNDYVSHDYSGNFYSGFSNAYISSFMYFMIILIVIGTIVICALFIYKKKPVKAYISSIIYYITLLILLNILKNLMVTLETDVITAEAARIYRDLSLISIVPQIFFILLFLLRGFGVNLGKFNFDNDLKELQITEQDSEEVEITFKSDRLKIGRNLRKFIREFGYYIKENKFIFIIICIIAIVAITFGIYKSIPEVIDMNYKQGEIFVIGNLKYKIEDSIITNIDYKGDSLGDVNYIVTKLYIENASNEDINLDYNNFRLEVNDNYLYPIVDKGLYFIDYAVNYYGKTIKANSKNTYSLVYKIKNTEIKDSYQIKIENGTSIQNKLQISKYNYVRITPIKITEVSLLGNYNLKEIISFENTNLGNSKITLSNPIITKKYLYDYEYCSNKICNTYKDVININYTKNDKVLIVMDYDYTIDKDIPFYKYSSSINGFVESFIKIRYKENTEVKYSTISNVTPNNLKNKIVIETTNKIVDSEDVKISIIIRNKEYLINLK